MKNSILSILLFAVLSLLLPLTSFLIQPPAHKPEASSEPAPVQDFLQTKTEKAPSADPPAPEQPPVIRLTDAATGQLLEVPVLEYMIGAAASEMPPNWPDEALKAQAVASHSYVLYQRDQLEDASGGWLTVDPARRQGFMTKEVLQSYWGEGFEQNWKRFEELFSPLVNTLITYEGKPAAAAYHAISSGHTEASENVWNEALPYLCGVDSVKDLAADGYAQTVTYTPQQMYDALAANFAGVEPKGDPGKWFGQPETSPAGTVLSIPCCGSFLRGIDLRQVLGLRSACFTIEYAQDVFAVTTRGYGHGVGLSQWGAKSMAEEGTDYRAILSHYFPGTQLVG